MSMSSTYDASGPLVGFPALPGSGAPPSRLNPRAPDFNQSVQPQQSTMVQHSSQVHIALFQINL